MRETPLEMQVMSSTETPVVRMLPFAHVLKIGGRSIIDRGRKATYPLGDALAAALDKLKLVIGLGRGIPRRPLPSVCLDPGLPTGGFAPVRGHRARWNAHLARATLA